MRTRRHTPAWEAQRGWAGSSAVVVAPVRATTRPVPRAANGAPAKAWPAGAGRTGRVSLAAEATTGTAASPERQPTCTRTAAPAGTTSGTAAPRSPRAASPAVSRPAQPWGSRTSMPVAPGWT
ncbi:unannotated protein [freshwater metagenome]|uniref:Unannotated protein n=1 Tax=freshwater metagenome TaxID=449393 RepID=A0A6J7KBR6_9ZZZZ